MRRQIRTNPSGFGWRRKAGDGSGAFLSGPHSVPLCKNFAYDSAELPNALCRCTGSLGGKEGRILKLC